MDIRASADTKCEAPELKVSISAIQNALPSAHPLDWPIWPEAMARPVVKKAKAKKALDKEDAQAAAALPAAALPAALAVG